MKITRLELTNFKRFTNLTIDQVPATAKLVLLIGSNGSGKSSVFDAFELLNTVSKTGGMDMPWEYYKKKQNSPSLIKKYDENGHESILSQMQNTHISRTPYAYY